METPQRELIAAEPEARAPKLRTNEQLLSDVFSSVQDGISILDHDMTIIRVNPKMEQWYAHAMPLVGKKCYEAYHGRVERCEVCPTHRTFETGHAAFENVPLTGAGGEVVGSLDLYSFPLVDQSTGEMTGVIEYVRDVTEQKRAESQLLQAQKMEAIGSLAGGVAHDFNNMLATILGHTELALARPDVPPSAASHLHEIRRTAEKAADLTRQLLAFSRKQTLTPEVTDLNETVDTMTKMLTRVIGENVTLEVRPAPGLWSVRVDRSQIEQVLLNLVVNARDALPRGGRVVIETRNLPLDEARPALVPGLSSGDTVLLAVRDTGVGMTPAVRRRIFEPFFTTKGQGKGTGLGLSTVYGIVQQSGGRIDVESAPGRGSTFTIYFPAVKEAAPAPAPAPFAPVARRVSETILLAEDELQVAEVVVTMLEELGYQVLTAANVRTARALFGRHRDRVDLLLTDVVMPDGNGPDLFRALRGSKPGLRAIFISGYVDDEDARNGPPEPNTGFLQKPFLMASLATKLREVLDR